MGDRGHNRHNPKLKRGAAVPLLRRAGTPSNTMWPGLVYFRTKWFLHPSNRLATIHMSQKLGGVGVVPIEHKVAYLHTKWHLDVSSRLATIKWAENWEGTAPFWGRGTGPHLAQCGLDH